MAPTSILRAAIAAGMAFAGTAPLGAQAANLVSNGTFDTNANGWTNAVLWDGTRDAGSNPASGSDQVSVSGNGCTSSNQCVAATPGTAYDLSAQVLISSVLTTGDGIAQVVALWQSTDCLQPLGKVISSDTTSNVGNAAGLDAWHGVSLAALVAPPTTKSIQIGLNTCSQTNNKFTANFDNVSFSVAVAAPPAGATAVPGLSVGMLALLATLVGAMGAWLRFRRA